MMDPALTLILIGAFLLLEGFFSGGELALITYNRIRMRHLAENGLKSAATVERLLGQPDKIFGTTSLGTNLSVFAGSSIATMFVAQRFGENEADFYSFLVMGPLTLLLGEIVPKTLFRQRADDVAPIIARPLELAQKLFTPILAVTSWISRFAVRMFVGHKNVSRGHVSREELLLLTKMGTESLSIEHDERKMIRKIFEFRTNTLESVMRPLVTVVGAPSVSTLAEAKARMAETQYSRLPVFVERIFNIVGIVSVFDVMNRKDLSVRLDKVMSPVFYTPITKKNADLLKEMQEKKIHMAVVVDEYGGAIGIVTIEDLVEEIVGEIEDEYDSPVKYYEKTGEGRYVINAMMEIDTINEELALGMPKGDYETMSGFINHSMERIPKAGERLAVNPFLITINDSTSRMVKSVELYDTRVETVEKESEPK
ncbi:MAG: HlyC/CorC family transporter [Nitrospinae bacterium]|nr:HlyC/CorC family transporter [Nitrospinota bacterium]